MPDNPWLTDDDKDTISITLDGKELRRWRYVNDADARIKMRMAREYAEGWHCASKERNSRVDALNEKLAVVRQTLQTWDTPTGMDLETLARAVKTRVMDLERVVGESNARIADLLEQIEDET